MAEKLIRKGNDGKDIGRKKKDREFDFSEYPIQ
jgi:hypothetical protein